MTGFSEPSTAVVLHPLNDFDPRARIEGGTLIEASRNAYPVVTAIRPRRDSLGVVAGTAVALVLGLMTFWTMSGHRSPPNTSRAPAQVTQPVLQPSPTPSVVIPPTSSTGSLILPRTEPWSRPLGVPLGTSAQPAHAPMIVFDSGGAPAQSTASASPFTAAPTDASPAGLAAAAEASTTGKNGRDENEGFFAPIAGRNAQVATAHQLTSPGTTVTQGTLIAAVLETSINTDIPGYVRALVSRDVRSFDGTQVLIPRSSRLIGQYKSGLSAGQTRAYVIWTRLIRPDGVSVTLDSPGVDFSGSAGLPGKVNSHFMKRFGSALLLSVVGGLSAAGTGGATLLAGGGGQSAASVAAGRDSAISPTIRVLQGEPIRVFTARDLDFSSVARLEASR